MPHLTKQYIPIVLCAGLGTRLRPLTALVPKTAAPMGSLPISVHSIAALLNAGFETIHCNTHYLAEFVESEIQAAVEGLGFDKIRVRFWREEILLETGGGIARIVQTLAKETPELAHRDVFVVSGDIYSALPIFELCEAWNNRPANTAALMATMALNEARNDVTWTNSLATEVIGFGKDIDSLESKSGVLRRLFTNHQIVCAQTVLSSNIEKKSSVDMFYRAALAKGQKILNFDWSHQLPWHNVGTYEEYAQCRSSLYVIDQVQNSKIQKTPDQCLVIADWVSKVTTENKKNSTEVSLYADNCATTLNLVQWPIMCGQSLPLNLLKTSPQLPSGVPLLKVAQKLLAYSHLPLTKLVVHGGPSAHSLAHSTVTLSDSSLCFTLSLPQYSLHYPILIPLELLLTLDSPVTQNSLSEFNLESCYSTSQTFILINNQNLY